MKLTLRPRGAKAAPGTRGVARVARRTASLSGRLRPGEVAVIDHVDLDRATARMLVDAEVAAVVNAAPFISGRYPNLGPEVLAQAGVVLIDGIGESGLSAVPDGSRVRVHDSQLFSGDRLLAEGRAVDLDTVIADMTAARAGLATQLESLAHNSAQFLRREEDLLLHGLGLPRLETALAGRPVVVVTSAPDQTPRLARLRRFVREHRPALVGVGRGADLLLAAGHRPDVVVLGARHGETDDAPSPKALRAATDVVALVDRGVVADLGGPLAQLERLGVRSLHLETGAAAPDAALLLCVRGDAAVVVAVGLRATLVELLDAHREGAAGTFLTRLAIGQMVVDADAVAQLYAGGVRARHLLTVAVTGLAALAAAVGVTPVGQEWGEVLVGEVDALAEFLRRVLR